MLDHLPKEHDVRKEKSKQLAAAGVPSFPERFVRTHSVAALQALASQTPPPSADGFLEQWSKPVYHIAWRIMGRRAHGKLTFAQLKDVTWTIQICFIQQHCLLDTGKALVDHLMVGEQSVTAYKCIEKFFDTGDFLGIRWELCLTKHGELTLLVAEMQLLTKALLPLPEKRHGLKDEDDRLRKRYLDIVMNPEVQAMVQRRSTFWQTMRTFLLAQGFIEVDTPILEVTTGGADATPFATHHNALDLDVFLRISCGELRQKRLMVAGLEKTFEIGRVFRNEGMSPEHAQDYTQMEVYRSYANFADMMALTKAMYLAIIDATYGKRTFHIRGFDVDFDHAWTPIDYGTIIQQKTGIDIFHATDQDICEKLSELKIKYEGDNRPRLIDSLWKYCRKQIAWPAFLLNVPTAVSPLAKAHPDNPLVTNRFQIIIAGSEVGNGFSELNDPLDQAARFAEQQALRDAGDTEAQMADREYVEALMHAMPPAAWFGVSERLFSFLENKPIRETQIFPLMKPLPSHVANVITAEETMEDIGTLPSRENVHTLINRTLTETKIHCLQVGRVMEWFAKKLWHNADAWYITGVLHDIDWDLIGKDPHAHLGEQFDQLMHDLWLPDPLIRAIKAHYPDKTHEPVDTLLKQYLISVDELVGFIGAYGRMRPGGLDGMEAASVIKKMKDKWFAAGIDRAHMQGCETYLNIPMATFITDIISALQTFPSQ